MPLTLRIEKGDFKVTTSSKDKQQLIIVSGISKIFKQFDPEHWGIELFWTDQTQEPQAEFCYHRQITKMQSYLINDYPGVFWEWPEPITALHSKLPLLHSLNSEFDAEPFWNNSKLATLDEDILSIPAYGLDSKQRWMDGWLLYQSKQEIITLIPPGSKTRLTVDLSRTSSSREDKGIDRGSIQHLVSVREESLRLCILDCLRDQQLLKPKCTVVLKTFDLLEAIQLLLLKQADTSSCIKVTGSTSHKLWPHRFRNFLESIDAEIVVMSSSEQNEWVDLGLVFSPFSQKTLLQLKTLLNAPSRILEGLKSIP